MSWKTYRGILQLLGGHRERLVVPPEREEPKSHAVPAEIAQAPQGVAGGRRSDRQPLALLRGQAVEAFEEGASAYLFELSDAGRRVVRR